VSSSSRSSGSSSTSGSDRLPALCTDCAWVGDDGLSVHVGGNSSDETELEYLR
jgi:hypothetical protein